MADGNNLILHGHETAQGWRGNPLAAGYQKTSVFLVQQKQRTLLASVFVG